MLSTSHAILQFWGHAGFLFIMTSWCHGHLWRCIPELEHYLGLCTHFKCKHIAAVEMRARGRSHLEVAHPAVKQSFSNFYGIAFPDAYQDLTVSLHLPGIDGPGGLVKP